MKMYWNLEYLQVVLLTELSKWAHLHLPAVEALAPNLKGSTGKFFLDTTLSKKATKGQLISEAIFLGFKYPKRLTKFFKEFLPLPLKLVKSKCNKGTLFHSVPPN